MNRYINGGIYESVQQKYNFYQVITLFQMNLSYAVKKSNIINFKNVLEAVISGDLNKATAAIQSRFNINHKPGRSTLLSSAILNATYSCNENQLDCETRLKIIELLIQAGSKINEPIHFNETALEYAMKYKMPSLPVIRLLLGYGAEITERVLQKLRRKHNMEEIIRIFYHHEKLINEAVANPDTDLLTEAIGYNKPYVVKIITDQKPQLVTKLDIEIAKLTSPASVPILIKSSKIAEFRKFSEKNKILPIELNRHLENFIAHIDNK